MSYFDTLKSNSIEQLKATIEKIGGAKFKEDDRFWQPTMDKSGNSYSVIRFLPEPKDVDGPDAVSVIKILNHAFKTDIGWYINDCPTVIGEACPVCEANSVLWNSGNEDNKNIARKRKRTTKYVSNIYIVNDPAHPENNGQVKLYKYGSKILDRINLALKPPFSDDVPFNPFNLWTGANFKLKIRIIDKQWSYDSCSFDTPGPLFTDDEKLRSIYESEYSLKDLIKPDVFKSYDQLKKRFDLVTGNSSHNLEREEAIPSANYTRQFESRPEVPQKEFVDPGFDDDDPDLNYFKSLID